MSVAVRCPSPACGDVFTVPVERLGRNLYCLSCGVRMTARPVEIDEALRRKQHRTAGGSGANLERLPFVAVVDNVRSLWNVGSIFRTADACGLRHLALAGITGCPPRPEIAKTALGAEDVVAWSYHADAVRAIAGFVAQGFTAVALESSPRAVSLDAVTWPPRTCLVIGNEVAGVAAPAVAACSLHAQIPMQGLKDSLNVAVAFGIAAYAASRALLQSYSAQDGKAPRPR